MMVVVGRVGGGMGFWLWRTRRGGCWVVGVEGGGVGMLLGLCGMGLGLGLSLVLNLGLSVVGWVMVAVEEVCWG